ncbi:MAG: hypothetical protein OEX02_03955, partial [Cyclobacteriaceae bacterium]|nr:hypothetical protein [Cyclobacteriaceae bacterium]
MLIKWKKAKWPDTPLITSKKVLKIFKLIFVVIVALLAMMSCANNEDPFLFDHGYLSFSRDTVLFDTLFTSRGSITHRFKVYNPGNNTIHIDEVKVGKENNSPYTLTINGERGKKFQELELLGHDSLLVLVDVTIDPLDSNLPFIVRDSAVFTVNGMQQDVKLLAWGQDAHFLGDIILSCDTRWTADRPYVLYSSILIDSLCTLHIDPGTRIYSNNSAALFVKGTILANGLPDQRILFTNDRLDDNYKHAPGQWEGIFVLEGSKNNVLSYTDIRNAVRGIRLGAPDKDTIPEVNLYAVR